jgi:hypothetical protein
MPTDLIGELANGSLDRGSVSRRAGQEDWLVARHGVAIVPIMDRDLIKRAETLPARLHN